MKKSVLLFSAFISLCFFGTAHSQETDEISLPKQSFWQNVDMEYAIGIASFTGDYENYSQFVNLSPAPANGIVGSLHFNKPFKPIYGMTPNARIGASFQTYRSKQLFQSANLSLEIANQGLAPTNINNLIFGPEVGGSLDIPLFGTFVMSPMVSFGIYFNDPRTDNFYNASGEIVRPNATRNAFTRDYSLRKTSGGKAPGEDIPSYIPALMAGGQLSFKIAGTDFFLSYTYKQFLNNYFDGVREISTNKGPNYSMNLSAGIRIPVLRGVRNNEIGRDFSTQLAYIRQNMDVDNQEHKDLFFETFEDIAIDRNTLGLSQNSLAAKVEMVELPLGNTSYTVEFSRIPGSTFVIGHADEDQFQIQNYGRIRVSVQDFLMSQTTITNRHYKLFLLAMGHTFEGSETYSAFITGEAPSFGEIVETARLSDVSLPEGIAMNGINDLIPDEESWNRQNLGNILSFPEYFYGPEFDEYPVVGINWYQARMFAAWAGFRLPNEVEWEYAAKSGVGGRTYPWEGYNAQDSEGEFMANFMQERGVYNLDGYTLMAPAKSFKPNDFGLYNMAGNVSEWMADSYSSTYQTLRSDQIMVTPANIDFSEHRKVHRGGSWASSLFFIGSGVRNYQLGQNSSPTVGFRVATSRYIAETGDPLDQLPVPEDQPEDAPQPIEPPLEETPVEEIEPTEEGAEEETGGEGEEENEENTEEETEGENEEEGTSTP